MAAAEAVILHTLPVATQMAKFQSRYKRFFVDTICDGTLVTAHCPNTGSMAGLLDWPGKVDCLISANDNPKRKLKYSLHAMMSAAPFDSAPVEPVMVGVHSAVANQLATAALAAGALDAVFGGATLHSSEQFLDTFNPMLSDDDSLAVGPARKKRARSPSAAAPRTRVDLILRRPDGSAIAVEVKSISMTDYLAHEPHSSERDIADVLPVHYSRTALFPDSVSVRAQRHVLELTEVQQKHGSAKKRAPAAAVPFATRAAANCLTCCAAILLVIQRADATGFAPCDRVDSAYGDLLREAVAAGVGAAAMVVDVTNDGQFVFKGVVPVFATHSDAVGALPSR